MPVQSEKAFEFHYDGRFRNPRAIAAPARVRQQLYAESKFTEILAQVDACLPKDEAGNFIAEQERSDVVHDLLAFLAERMLEMVSVSCSGALLAPPRFDDQS